MRNLSSAACCFNLKVCAPVTMQTTFIMLYFSPMERANLTRACVDAPSCSSSSREFFEEAQARALCFPASAGVYCVVRDTRTQLPCRQGMWR